MVIAGIGLAFALAIVIAFAWGQDHPNRPPYCARCDAASRRNHPGGAQ